MSKCKCKCAMSMVKKPCKKSDFPCHRCISKQKNIGKIWRVQTVIEIQSARRNFPAFGQKLFWDFFPIPDPCDETVREPYITISAEGSNEKQVITIEGTPVGGLKVVGGYFTLKYYGQTTDRIPYNASASTVQSALAALTNIGFGNVSVTGGVGEPWTWTVNFIGELAGTHVWFLKADSSNLFDVSTYEPVPGLSEEDTRLVECVCGIAGYGSDNTWFKTPYKVVANGVELIVYLYFLRGTWRLTLRYSDYTNGPSGTFDYAIETLRSVAHYTSEESACFLPDSAVFTLGSYTATLLFNGIEPEDAPPGEILMGWPETATFSTVDVGDFFDTVPITPV